MGDQSATNDGTVSLGIDNGTNQATSQTNQSEEQKYWAAVRDNPSDFNSWSSLLHTVDQKASIDDIRVAYGSFLSEFPLCYVYWKRYVDHEVASGSSQEKVVEIYERAVEAFPLSVDLWTYYCSYLADRLVDSANVRRLFERAIEKVGTDYLAQSLWDKYLEYELSQKDFTNVTRLYTRVLSIPLEALSKYYERWKVYASAYPVGDILSPEEKQQLGDLETDEAKRAKTIARREEVYQATQQELTRIHPYESVLRSRPYFHVTPLSEELLETWHAYLTFQEAEGNTNKTVQLYERCLVPCCNYAVYWRRYAFFVENVLGPEAVKGIWERATGKLLKRRVDPFLDYALFEEAQGRLDVATHLYQQALSFAPGHVEATLRYAQLAQRQHNLDEVMRIFETTLESPKTEAGAGAFLSMHQARFVERFLKDTAKARTIYQRALEHFPANRNLWLAAVDFEVNQSCSQDVDAFEHVVKLFKQATGDSSLLSESDKLDLWQTYIETMHAFAPRIDFVKEAYGAFRKTFPSGKLNSKKRRYDEDSDYAMNKKTRPAAPATNITAGTSTATSPYPMGYGMGYGGYAAYGTFPSAGYGAWPQAGAYGAAASQQAYAGYTG